MLGLVGAALAAGVATGWTSPPRQERPPPPRMILLVRHGEKASEPRENPPLSAAGQERAGALADALRDAGVTAIITTDQQRTIQTAAPLAATLHLAPVQLAFHGEHPEEHARAMAAAARRAGGIVVLVDHQVAIPLIIAALGGPRETTICDVEFSNLYILVPGEAAGTGLAHAHYGRPDPPHDPRSCRITPRSPP